MKIDATILHIPYIYIASMQGGPPTSYKYGYKSTYRGYNPSYPIIRPFIGVRTPFITIVGAHLVCPIKHRLAANPPSCCEFHHHTSCVICGFWSITRYNGVLRGSGYLGYVDSNQGYNPYKWVIRPLTRVINLHITSY